MGEPIAMAPAMAGGVQPLVTAVSQRPRKRANPIFFAALFLVALVVVAVGSFVLANSMRTPEAQVRRYLDYLAQGNASAATAMVDPGVANDERVFLTDQVMASATSLLDVEDVVDRDEGSSSKKHTVNATVLVDGSRFTFPFEVREGKPTLGVIKNWTIENALVVPVAVRIKDATTFSVGGVTAPVSDYDSFPFTSPTYLFYPGVYEVNAADLGEYIDAEPATLRATREEYLYGADPLTNVTIETSYSQSLRAAAVEAMAAQTTSCATPPGNLDTVCPFGLQRTDLTVLEVKQMPTEAKEWADSTSEFHDYAFFKVQQGAGTPIYTLKSTVYATLKFDEKGKVVVDSAGKPQFWLRYEVE
ncbi:hypothetical protein [Actinomyces sp.]|jgi:hypothetical protein|uniref:hypothetical protein n=1 Tax=Actinomyces sp. TaxID=29317 RepID=UPI0025BBB69E|nr:hypothetical protein [Actinomyces sp.]